MKKKIALLLVFVMVFALFGCGDKDSSNEKNSTSAMGMKESVSAKLDVEDFKIVDIEDDEFTFKVKLRNISENDIEFIEFDYQCLDANGDILCYATIGATNVAAGQAIWAGTYPVRDVDFEEIVSICFVSDALPGMANTPLKEKVVFNLDDYM